MALKEWDDTNQAELTKFREAAYDARLAAVKAFAATNMCAECTSKDNVMTYLESTMKSFTDQFPGKRVDDVLRINVFNLPMQGPGHSRHLPDTAHVIKTECSHHPRTAVAVVFLPNTPKWGDGQRGPTNLPKLVQEARANTIAKLQEECQGLIVQDCIRNV